MKDGKYEVGDQVVVYNQVREVEEVCDHGEKHRVPVYSVKRLTITDIRQEMVTALAYTHDAMGDVLYAVDAQGRKYRKEPHWDGPRASVWLRIMCRTYFSQYPRKVFSRDVTGRVLVLR
jgi:hypothetical protein